MKGADTPPDCPRPGRIDRAAGFPDAGAVPDRLKWPGRPRGIDRGE